MMNGIKEEIKTIGVMNPGSPDYQEALTNLLTRIKKLKVGFLIFQRVKCQNFITIPTRQR